jgi:methylated-DNA-[protein]-cysteine S-methyltransferase
MSVYYSRIDSPIGELVLTGDGRALTGLFMENQRHGAGTTTDWQRDDALFADARQQLAAYFAGERQTFDLPLAPTGTAFQRRVWQALRDIPFGKTESYGALARRIDSPKASRAVGLANGRNPISIIVPCHRVIGADGSLTGYGGGIERKRWLLTHEGHADDPALDAAQLRLI